MQRKFLAPALVLVALLTLLAFFGLRVVEATPAMTFAEEKREVYLTFDDGPSTIVTGRVLDTLKEENVKATFFIVSDRAYNREDTLRRIAAEGHTLGVHSATHIYHEIYASDEALLKDVAMCENVITRVTGVKPTVYRFPGGGSSAKQRHTKLLEARGYRVVGWNAACGDAEIYHASPDTLVQETVKTSQGKQSVILLMHDSANHKATAAALPRIIAYYREQGYTFCQF